MAPAYRTTAYRYPNETIILAVTIVAVVLVVAITATATLCLSALFIIGFFALSYQMTQSHHRSLIERAYPINSNTLPELDILVKNCTQRLHPGPIEAYVAPTRELNAYTFGISGPKVVVLYSSLIKVMDADELRFIIGHELGHVQLGHTWLNTLIGGMAGIPAPYEAAILLTCAFRWWNRACEYSADRAGLLTCGGLNSAISALIKLGSGGQARTPAELERALKLIDQEDDNTWNVLAETLASHPMIIRRINELRRYAATNEYRQIQAKINQNG